MRHCTAAALTSLALISLAACGKSATTAGGTSSAAAPGASGPVSVTQFPARKPGLWQQQIAMDGPASGPRTP